MLRVLALSVIGIKKDSATIMSDSIAFPWRKSRGPSALSDMQVLETVGRIGTASIYDISEDRVSKSRLRLQCRYLRKLGLLQREGSESYSLSDDGADLLGGEQKLPQSDGYLHLRELLDFPDERITDMSVLNQEDLKQINYERFRESESVNSDNREPYSVDVRDPRRKARKVLSAKKWKLDRLLREFPRTEPLASQCAHWVTSLVSFHFFPDANHRTAMISLYQLALGNDVIKEDHRWPGSDTEIAKAVLLSKFHRHLSPRRTFDRLWRRDTLYWHWYQYFEFLLFDVRYPALKRRSEEQLREKLRRVRNT